ncbi:unnamed protein product [Cylicostephanus goldi]|uniref:Uncharacterized protein n=1 Tax=Cylicostephanus goldi TaxID=71465 RepID=A0A3P7R2A5_CYLGO|nr:unnamed protein product [Cylicostephanus goldi]
MSAPLVPNVDPGERGDVRGWWFSKEDNQFSSRDVCSIATGFEQSVGGLLIFVRFSFFPYFPFPCCQLACK